VPRALNPDLVSVFGRDLRDLFLEKSNQVNTTAPFLRLYGDELKSGRIEEKGDELIRKVFRRFLERKNIEEIEWMAKAIKGTNILKQVREDSVNDFLSRAKGVLREEGVPEEIKEVIKEVIRDIVSKSRKGEEQ
jgi:urease gamma subunit